MVQRGFHNEHFADEKYVNDDDDDGLGEGDDDRYDDDDDGEVWEKEMGAAAVTIAVDTLTDCLRARAFLLHWIFTLFIFYIFTMVPTH